MGNGRATINGLRARVDGLEKLMEKEIQNIGNDISELKADVKDLRKFQYKALGVVAVLLALFQAAMKYLPLILQNGK